MIDHMDRDKPDAWTSVMGRDCRPRAQQRNGALGKDKSPGSGAANTSQLRNLACLVWLAGNHGSPWLAPVAMWGHRSGQAAKGPKSTSKSHVLHRRWGGKCQSKGSSTYGQASQKYTLPISCRSHIHIPKLSTCLLSRILPLKTPPVTGWLCHCPVISVHPSLLHLHLHSRSLSY